VTAWTTVAAVLVSLAAIAWLAATDPKRRRVFDLPPARRRPVLAWTAALLPGAWLAWLGNGAGFVTWLGASTVLGWGLAALPPAAWRAARSGLRHAAAAVVAGLRHAAALPRQLAAIAGAVAALCRAPSRIDALERRVAELEAGLAAQTSDPPARSASLQLAADLPGRKMMT
jgi:hypothetical protein